jgi:small subunit ribosomal protein S6
MVAPAPTYDLMLMLDPKAEQATRTKIRSDVKAMIEQGGSIIGDHDYGNRKMAFEINHEANAEYDLVQFHGPNSVLEQLQRTLRITDGVTRFRIIKLRAGVGDPPDLRQEAPPVVAEVVAEVEVVDEAVEAAVIEEVVEEAVIEAVVEEAVAEEIVEEAIAEVAVEEAVAEAEASDAPPAA